MNKRIFSILLTWAMLLGTGFAQTTSKDTLLTTKKMASDLKIYKTVLKESHAGLNWYIKPDALEDQFRSVEKAIAKPLYKNDFYKLLLQLTARLKHGHSFLVNDQVYGINYRLRDLVPTLRYLPMTISIVENKLYISVNCSSESRLVAGSQIISINGKPVDKLLSEFYKYIPADGGNISYKNYKLEQFGFHYLYSLLYPKKDRYKIVFKALGSDALISSSITGIIPDSLEGRSKRLTGRSINYFPRSLDYTVLGKNKSIGYLKIFSFYEGLTNRNGMEFNRFFDSSFNKISTQKIKKLILDLRDNEGGNDMLALLLFSHLTDMPFNNGNPTYLKSDQMTTLRYIETPDEEIVQFAKQPGLFEDKKGDQFILKKEFDEISYQVFQPKNPIFNGTLVILTNGGSFSATSRFINLADHYLRKGKRIVRFAGTNYGGNDSFGFASGGEEISLILPNSHFRLTIPVKGFTRLKPSVPGDMVILDKKINIGIDDPLKKKDLQLQKAIEYADKL